jgi:hypothetical protein
MRYRVIKSQANQAILAYLGLPFSETADAIVFEGDIRRDLARIADAIRILGYARDDADAVSLAKSFFLNPVEVAKE